MALSVGDIVRVVFSGILFGKTWEFSSFRSYVAGDTPANYGLLADLAAGRYTTALAPILGGNTICTAIKIENLTNTLDIFERAVNIGGLNNSTTELPAFFSYGFQITRETRSTRHGSARVPGVPEAAVNSGVIALTPTIMQTAANFFGLQWDVTTGPTADYTFVPVIVGRTKQVVGDKEYYVYDLSRVNAVTGATFRGFTTQNSRKS